MHDSIFREYDIRGKINSEFAIDDVYDLVRSIAFYFKHKNADVKTVAVGMDGRLSCPAIKERMVAALTQSGLDVLFIGVCPSPVLYFVLHTFPVDAGLMITASHNPADYNGIKISLGTECVWGAQIKEIRDLYRARKFLTAASIGTYKEQEVIPRYVAWLRDHFPALMGMRLAAVVDCGNGTGGAVMPTLIKAMGWKNVALLCAAVDGTYPNHEADPVVEKNMQDVKHALAETSATMGIGLDGDGDRMAAMTKAGYLVPGDQLLAVFAQEILKAHPGRAIVFDVKASSGLIELLQAWDAKPCISPCGHAIIKNQMKECNAVLGGELSCHFFFEDRYFGYDDGIYAMMRLFEILQQTGKSLDELIRVFPKKYSSPEIRFACPEEKKQLVIDYLESYFKSRTDVQLLTIDGIRATFSYGWANVRASNTQPVLSMRFEGDTPEDLHRIKQEMVALLSNFFDNEELKKQLGI